MPSDRSTRIENAHNVTVNQSGPNYRRRPALISKVLKTLSELPPGGEEGSAQSLATYGIEDKLDHNQVYKYRDLIEEYGDYGQNVIKTMATINQEKVGSEKKILTLIKGFYREIVGEIRREVGTDVSREEIIQLIRQRSDEILDLVISRLVDLVNDSANGHQMDEEDLVIGTKYVVAHAFIECKVLERP